MLMMTHLALRADWKFFLLTLASPAAPQFKLLSRMCRKPSLAAALMPFMVFVRGDQRGCGHDILVSTVISAELSVRR
jgi:hypothetical protein